MIYRPISLILIALIHIFEPFTKVIFYSVYYGVNPLRVIEVQLKSQNYLHVFEFFFLFPIAGLAIFRVKKWSLYIFLLVELWVCVANFNYYYKLFLMGNYALLSMWILFLMLNISVVAYLLLPAVRIAYLDPKVRWWEAKPRYQIDIPCKINEEVDAKILNISETGVFVQENGKLEDKSEIKIKFDFEDLGFDFTAEVVHKFAIDNISGYGIQFKDLNSSDKRKIKKLTKIFEKKKVPRRPPKRNLLKEFKYWIKHLGCDLERKT